MHSIRRPATVHPGPSTAPGFSLLTRIAALDFTRPWAAAALAGLFVLSRLPMLNLGYGADADAWRVAISGRWFWAHHAFYPSRLPGYPVYEALQTLLIPGGWIVTNTATMLVSLGGVFLFARILRHHAVEPKGLLVLTFAFTPLLWINSTVTMDYMWATTALLASYLLLVHRHHLAAGLLLGLAAGCRPVALGFAGPFLLIVLRERDVAAGLRLAGAALLTTVGAFTPIWLRYGPRFLDFADWRPTWGEFARTVGVEAGSLLTFVSLVALFLLSLPEMRRLPAMIRRDGYFGAWLAAVLLVLSVFLRLPLEEGYLIPAVPFALLVMARLLRQPVLVAACAAIVLGGFVDIYTASAAGWSSPTAILHLRPEAGRVIVDRRLRQQRMTVAEEAWNAPLPEHSVLTMGYYFPIYAELFHDRITLRFREPFDPRVIGPLTDITEAVDDRDRAYVWLLTEGQVRKYQRRGYSTWTMDYTTADRLTLERTIDPALERYGPR